MPFLSDQINGKLNTLPLQIDRLQNTSKIVSVKMAGSFKAASVKSTGQLKQNQDKLATKYAIRITWATLQQMETYQAPENTPGIDIYLPHKSACPLQERPSFLFHFP